VHGVSDGGGQREVLAQQLAMNRQSWLALQEHGMTEESELRLDFFYVSPSEQQANALRAFIQDETDYDVRVGSNGGGLLKKKNWLVTGSTQPTQASQDILDQWVRWMVAAGFEHGCEFDGWGAEAG
jgi:hypothetical protein